MNYRHLPILDPEAAWVLRHFADLAGSEALGLKDDAALLQGRAGWDQVLSVDQVLEGIHVEMGSGGGHAASKLLRRGLSDLAAMGASATGYLLSLCLSEDGLESWIGNFAKQLARDQPMLGVQLLGGDLGIRAGPFALSITVVGVVPTGQAIRRVGAEAEDDLWVSGSLGDAALALWQQGKGLQPSTYLMERLYRPEPRLGLGQALRGLAKAGIDISDGLLADAGRLAMVSGLDLELFTDDLPQSEELQHWREGNSPQNWGLIITGGDDYELLFACDPSKRHAVTAAAQAEGLNVTHIGRFWPCIQESSGAGASRLGLSGVSAEYLDPKASFLHLER